jgi:hypothetical protein
MASETSCGFFNRPSVGRSSEVQALHVIDHNSGLVLLLGKPPRTCPNHIQVSGDYCVDGGPGRVRAGALTKSTRWTRTPADPTAMSPAAQFEPDVRADDPRATSVCVIGHCPPCWASTTGNGSPRPVRTRGDARKRKNGSSCLPTASGRTGRYRTRRTRIGPRSLTPPTGRSTPAHIPRSLLPPGDTAESQSATAKKVVLKWNFFSCIKPLNLRQSSRYRATRRIRALGSSPCHLVVRTFGCSGTVNAKSLSHIR